MVVNRCIAILVWSSLDDALILVYRNTMREFRPVCAREALDAPIVGSYSRGRRRDGPRRVWKVWFASAEIEGIGGATRAHAKAVARISVPAKRG